MRRAPLALLFLLLTTLSCDTRDQLPTEPESAAPAPTYAQATLMQSEHFFFLPPLGDDPTPTGEFDPSFLPYLTVSICELSGDACAGAPLAEYTSEGNKRERLRIDYDEEHYIVNWWTKKGHKGKTYRIAVLAGEVAFGYADIAVDKKTAGSTVPVRFRVEQGIPGAKVVGSSGGEVSGSGTIRLTIPQGALTDETMIQLIVAPPDPDWQMEIGEVITLLPDDLQFEVPVTLTLSGESLFRRPLFLGINTENGWAFRYPSDYDPTTSTLTAELSHFSSWSYHINAGWPLGRTYGYELEGFPLELVGTAYDCPACEEYVADDIARAIGQWTEFLSDAEVFFCDIRSPDCSSPKVMGIDFMSRAEVETEFGIDALGAAKEAGVALFNLLTTKRFMVLADELGTDGGQSPISWVPTQAYADQAQSFGGGIGIESIALHEFGHILGLDHNGKGVPPVMGGGEGEILAWPRTIREKDLKSGVWYGLMCLYYREGGTLCNYQYDGHWVAEELRKDPGFYDRVEFAPGSLVHPRPLVTVLDAEKTPVPGVTVIFTPVAGYPSGSITGRIQTTNERGEAAVGGWVLSEEPGEHRVVAQVLFDEVATRESVEFAARATSGLLRPVLGLGSLGGESYARAINGSNWIVGASDTDSGEQHAFLWRDGVMTDLGTPGFFSAAHDVNEAGQVVGSEWTVDSGSGFLWEDGVKTPLDFEPTAINAVGQIVGRRQNEAVVYRNGTITRLFRGVAADINDRGQVVGQGYVGDEVHAVLWTDGELTDLGTLAGGRSAAFAINESGQVVGESSWSGFGKHAFLWDAGVMEDLGVLGTSSRCGGQSRAWGMNESGQVVGTSTVGGACDSNAFLWEDGIMIDLGPLEGESDAYAGDINDAGAIVGARSLSADMQALLWFASQS